MNFFIFKLTTKLLMSFSDFQSVSCCKRSNQVSFYWFRTIFMRLRKFGIWELQLWLLCNLEYQWKQIEFFIGSLFGQLKIFKQTLHGFNFHLSVVCCWNRNWERLKPNLNQTQEISLKYILIITINGVFSNPKASEKPHLTFQSPQHPPQNENRNQTNWKYFPSRKLCHERPRLKIAFYRRPHLPFRFSQGKLWNLNSRHTRNFPFLANTYPRVCA